MVQMYHPLMEGRRYSGAPGGGLAAVPSPLPALMPRLLLLALAALCLASAAHAQSGPDTRRVVLTNGTILVGTVADETADPVVIVTRDGVEQRVPRAQVAEITPLIGGRFFRVDPTRTRLVLSPTGRTLGRGRTRVGTLVYIVPNATVGVSDRIDLSGTAFIGFGGDDFAFVPVVGGKVGLVDTGTFAAAVGTNVGLAFGGGDEAALITPYAAMTVGSETRSASASVTGFVGGDLGAGDFETADGVLLSFGGEAQVNNGVKLLVDVLATVGEGDDGVALLPGVRLFGDRYSVDVFGAIGIADGDVIGFAPFANFAFTF